MIRQTKILLCLGAALAALAPHAGTSTAAFTSAGSNPGNTIRAGSLTAVSGVGAAQAAAPCTADAITVSWTAGGGLSDQSMVERRIDGGSWTTVYTGGATTWTEPSAFSDGTTLGYRVRSKLSGSGTWDTDPVSAPIVRCGFAVASLAATNPCNQVDLTWAAPAGGADSYDVEVDVNGSWTRLASAQAATSYVDGEARPSTGATYRVRPRHADGTIGFWSTTTLGSWSTFRLSSVQFNALSGGAAGSLRTGDTAVFTFSKAASTSTPANNSSETATLSTTSMALPSVGTVGGSSLFSRSGTVSGTYTWNSATQLTWKATANTTVTQNRALAPGDTFAIASPGITCDAVAGATLQATSTTTFAGRF